MPPEQIAAAAEETSRQDSSLSGGADVSAESSTATQSDAGTAPAADSTAPKTAFEAVQQMMEKRAEAASKPAAGDAASSDGQKPADATGKDGEVAGTTAKAATGEAEEESFEPIRQPKTAADHRFNVLLKQKKADERALAELRPAAEGFEAMRSFVKEHGLEKDDINEAMEFARLLRSDRRTAYKEISRLHAHLAKEFGDSDLPDDLQAAVDEGRVSDDYARELAQARAMQVHETGRREQEKTRADAEAATRSHQEFVASITSALSEYETDWRSKDPDYPIKQKLVQDRVTALLASGEVPRTAQEAVAQVKAAREYVEKTLEPVVSRRRTETRDLTGGQSRDTRGAEPKTALEAAQSALMRTRAA